MSAKLLYMVRHGAPEMPGLLMGRTDGAPTLAGIATCVEKTTGLAFDAIVSSDLLRARKAAEAMAQRCGTPMTIDPRWRELDFGLWDGLAPSTVAPDALGRFHDDPDANPPPQGERWSTLQTRVAAAIGDLSSAATLVVTHAGAMRAALAHLCGFTAAQIWAFDLPYGALISLRIWPEPHPGAQIIGLRA
ncbi:histidine phosphatase family protein [Sphingobium sp. CR2-8]|uniref:histidine phosphatase family protein n=1 Tax=Sphingobium sp. CR2-8 TaxID=1306534 RepID=UPI002DBB07A4|nr:histidine phosphatase family protein [Sphingobium sp. CR2-8]MEC3909813.1 histidine phosphatase family protein [Sphingobium sp. CR2-8]